MILPNQGHIVEDEPESPCILPVSQVTERMVVMTRAENLRKVVSLAAEKAYIYRSACEIGEAPGIVFPRKRPNSILMKVHFTEEPQYGMAKVC